MNKEISDRIKIIGFLMTCVIAAYHCGTPKDPINAFDMKWNTFIGYTFESVAALAMSYFFMVTGFLLFYDLSFKNYFEKIRKRLYSLLLPYLLWQIIIMLKIVIMGGAGLDIKNVLRANIFNAVLASRWGVMVLICSICPCFDIPNLYYNI